MLYGLNNENTQCACSLLKILKMDNNEPKKITSNEVSCIYCGNIYNIKCVYPNMNIVLSNLSFFISVI